MKKPTFVNPQVFGSPIKAYANKGRKEFLPSRHALDKLVRGDPSQRTTQQYAKRTPSGASAPGMYDDIQAMAENFGTKLTKR